MSRSRTVCNHRHSSAHGDAFTRGGRTSTLGAGSRPASRISLMPRGYGAEVAFIWVRRSQVARLQTNSRVSSTKAIVSFQPSDENITMAGLVNTALKYEYGARLMSPFALIGVIQLVWRVAR